MDLVVAMATGAGAVISAGCAVDCIVAYWRAPRDRQCSLAGAFVLWGSGAGALSVLTVFFLARAIVGSSS